MGNKIDRILKTSLPADAAGNVSVHDVLHWLHDEQYLNADVFTQPEVKKQVRQTPYSLNLASEATLNTAY